MVVTSGPAGSRVEEAVLFLDWVRFPEERWKMHVGASAADAVTPNNAAVGRDGNNSSLALLPPILKVSALTYDLGSQKVQDEVSYCVKCDAVKRFLTDEEVEGVLGMSKLVYMVATGLLETILPALLDKLDPNQVIVAIWDRDRFKQEMQPHLQQVLQLVDPAVARAFSRLFVVREALRARGGDSAACGDKVRAVDAADLLHLKLKKGSELEAMCQVARALNQDGTLFNHSDGRHLLMVPIVTDNEVAAETPYMLKSESEEPSAAGSTLPGDSFGVTPVSVDDSKHGSSPASGGDEGSMNSGGSYWIRLRGLPWEASMQDVLDFLAPVFSGGISTNKIHILQARQGRCSGEAYVEAPSDELRDRCVKELHGNLVGRRWIEVFKSSALELEDAKQRCQQLAANDIGSGGILRLRGLPWGSTEYEVMRFFQDGGFAVETCNIVVPPARGARCSGEAWVDLRSAARAEDARRALHRQCIGSRYIEIFPSNQKEFYAAQKAAQGVAPGAYPTPTRMRGPRSGPMSRRYADGPYEDVGSSPSSVMDSDVFLQRSSTSRMNSNVGLTATAADVYHGSDSRSLPPMTIMSLPTSSGAQTDRMTQPSSYFPNPTASAPAAGRHFIGVSNPVPSSLPYPTGPRARKFPNEVDQYPFTVLRLRGLPYGSNENHIVQFFLGFSMTTILPSTVPVDGRPSGEAYVEFVSAEEALRAFQLRQGARIEHRYIELFPASKQEMEYAAAGLDPREIRLRLGY